MIAILRFLTSLSFLYALTIGVLLVYGFFYYRDFIKSGYHRRGFPYVFLIISAACFSFLYFNMKAPLSLRTFSNLEHHFIRHDGFQVARNIVLGRTDTVNNESNSYSRFVLGKENDQVVVTSAYSEEPFYASTKGTYKLLSASYPASGHTISFRCDSNQLTIRSDNGSGLDLIINGENKFTVSKILRKGSSAWNYFKDQVDFINSPWYTNDRVFACLRNIWLLRDQVSLKDRASNPEGELKYFLSGRIFQYTSSISYDEKRIQKKDLFFKSNLNDRSSIAWGLGFLDNNRNQFQVRNMSKDSFALLNRYPVSYPLSEENRNDWNKHVVNKFLVADSKDMLRMPAVFKEGFLFSTFNGDSSIGFSPVLLAYQKAGGDEPLQLKARFMNPSRKAIQLANQKLILPAKTSDIGWIFSIQNTFDWDFGSRQLSARTWQWMIFGTLLLFAVLIFFHSWSKPAFKLSWVWQLLSCISLVLLTTRFFLYWRYKSFPPYEGMDLPSQQQLLSFWNFGIIIFATILLAVIFGSGLLKSVYQRGQRLIAYIFNRRYNPPAIKNEFSESAAASLLRQRIPILKRIPAKILFFASWLFILLSAGVAAAINQFDPATCRHLAIGLILGYFLYVFISYKHSPLVASAETSWWDLHTGRSLDIIINNPVKVLLSISLLAVFVFIDIGFAIVFLNFLLFNEAFLCINYAIAGLSAGSQKNSRLFGVFGFIYLLAFVLNLLNAPYIFEFVLGLPQLIYLLGYILFAIVIAYNLVRVLVNGDLRRKILTGTATGAILFMAAFLFFPKEKILEKAAITKYRIDVMTLPVDKAIEQAYAEGKTYEPVIRAAQNQWFINTFIYEKNNPGVQSAGFQLLPHAPQNKGAKYNAQATDLVASRFFLAEHGKWSVLLYVLLLLVPTTLLASFYKLYPDFTNRINTSYPTITAGFSILNYLLITALLVILAATGRYIFFGQDLPFGSILSKQSVLFPSILIIAIVLLFKNIPLEQYRNRRKLIPGIILFAGLALILFFVKPEYNKNKEFGVVDLANKMEVAVAERLQPVLDFIDTSRGTRRLKIARKDKLFTDSIRRLFESGFMRDGGSYFGREVEAYTRGGFARHLDQSRMLYLDLTAGRPQLAVNNNYFRIEPPPHLQQSWTGNVFGDSTIYNVSLWNTGEGSAINKRMTSYSNEPEARLNEDLALAFMPDAGRDGYESLYLVNKGRSIMHLQCCDAANELHPNDTVKLANPSQIIITDSAYGNEKIITVEPDAFMKNYYVNGSRFYIYPMSSRFIWARNFAESISSEYSDAGQMDRNAFVSLDFEIMDSLSEKIQKMIGGDTAYKKGAEYGICIADGNGRVIAMTDYIKGLNRPDPNDKSSFMKAIAGDNGYISQSLLRKEVGNINLLRMNPGPGSTFKPIVFSAIASQLNLDWDQFGSEGFSEPQHYFGGEKVAEYDFEKNNGRINKVTEYLKYSDNYYHANVLLLGSYPKQPFQRILNEHFVGSNPEAALHWPYFSYEGKSYWLDGFENWPGYKNGKADFGPENSFTSIGLIDNYGIYTGEAGKSFDKFSLPYDSSLFRNAYRKSGFILPEYGLFDQQGSHVNHRIPYDLFSATFRGHVKGSSQVLVAPVKMLDAFGKLVTQSRNYTLTLNPYASSTPFSPFYVDSGILYNNYLSLIRENVFAGMREALYHGTAARLGTFLEDGSPYYYYAKTGTTGDNEVKTKSKLFAIVISSKDIADPNFNFRNNKFYTIYFTSQNGPAKQNEEFQAAVIKYLQQTVAFTKYMGSQNVKEKMGKKD